ncbi:hypothetical protein AYL99_08700 [Fonsecaea erecta]|uniref:Carboxymuconolactone decarboxylase-like domain-containing protein n=1 Tax=Fonsecaea erecta TaxID=1367422 RepID=A0A178Z9X2_9EURO|nr:hypothetical protein AYL99_08700 [Fonsecaea erecta]OAP56588.1 hypothetical protein AYL99_08700 [Fonsecaea erecta]
MRLSYVSDSDLLTSTSDRAVIDRIRHRRGDLGLAALDRALLHATPLADGWNSFFDAVRNRCSLRGDLRELAICRVAALNQAWYEWNAHEPLALQEGVSEKGVKGLVVLDGPDEEIGETRGYEAGLTRTQIAVKKYTDAMTRFVTVPQDIFGQLSRVGLNEREIIELTMTIAGYNCVSRFLVALDIGEQNGKGPIL